MEQNTEGPKFEFTGETKPFAGTHLKRIRAIRDIRGSGGRLIVRAGALGGWLERVENLSDEGSCWVSGEAMVRDGARVSDNAQVQGSARIHDVARVYGNAYVSDQARIGDYAQVYDSASIYDRALILGNVQVYGEAAVCGPVTLGDMVHIRGTASPSQGSFYGPALIETRDSYMTFCNVGTENGNLTVYRAVDDQILCVRGCFLGTVDEFIEASAAKHDEVQHAEYKQMIELAVARIRRLSPPTGER